MEIKTKYNPGDVLWGMHENRAQEFTVETVTTQTTWSHSDQKARSTTERYGLRIGDNAGRRLELCLYEMDERLYRTKKGLINSL